MTQDERDVAYMVACAKVGEHVATAHRGETRGAGVIECPVCGQTALRYAFRRGPGLRNGQAISARCDTERCVMFSGH